MEAAEPAWPARSGSARRSGERRSGRPAARRTSSRGRGFERAPPSARRRGAGPRSGARTAPWRVGGTSARWWRSPSRPSPRGDPQRRPAVRAPRGRPPRSARLGAGGAPSGAAGGALGRAGFRGGGPCAGVVGAEGLLGRQGHHPDVAAGDHQELRAADLVGSVERRKRGLVDGEELAVALGHIVGQAAAGALARERELALDPVAIGLEHDGFVAHVHERNPSDGYGGGRLEPAKNTNQTASAIRASTTEIDMQVSRTGRGRRTDASAPTACIHTSRPRRGRSSGSGKRPMYIAFRRTSTQPNRIIVSGQNTRASR